MTAITRTDAKSLITSFSRDQVDLIKRQYAKNATDDELKLFLYVAQSQGLDPLRKQIYFRKQKNGEVVHITSIDGYRLMADRTGKYAGNDDPVFDEEDNPRKATVTVYKIIGGIRCPFSATARWDQYYPGDAQGFMWRKMPHLMLGKCAEALALRKAFPGELGGVYIKEEMDQAGIVDVKPEPAPEHDPVGDRGDPYDPENLQHKQWLWGVLKAKGLMGDDAKKVSEMMKGKYEDEMSDVIDSFLGNAI